MAPTASLPAALNHLPASDSWNPLTSALSSTGYAPEPWPPGLPGCISRRHSGLPDSSQACCPSAELCVGQSLGIIGKGQQPNHHLTGWHYFGKFLMAQVWPTPF